MSIDDKTRTELRRLPCSGAWSVICANRTDVQNIDLMNLAGFCRNCLSNWMKEEADAKGARGEQGREPRGGLRHAL